MTDKPQGDLSFKVLNLLSKERAIYGLRNGDHERYRRHCANKIHRLRQVTHTTCGKGKVYKKPSPLTKDSIQDVRHLHFMLFSVERALTHSHQLRTLARDPKVPKETKRDQISWLRRALKLSTFFYDLSISLVSDGRLNNQTLAEISIYHLSVRAELFFEKNQFPEVLTDLAVRRNLLTVLRDAAKDSYDQALASESMDAYDPMIRFAAYKLGRTESHDIEGVVSEVDAEMMEETLPGFGKLVESLRAELGANDVEEKRKVLEDIEFAGDKVEFRSAEMVGVMLKVQDALKRLKGKTESGKGRSMKGWDKVLAVLGEAEEVAKRLVDDHEAAASTSLRSAETSKSLSFAHQYIVFLLLSHRIRRDLLLAESLRGSTPLPTDISSFKVPGGRAKLAEAVKGLGAMVKLYDTVLQSMTQLRSLAIVEERDEVRAGTQGLEDHFHATRCFLLARLHCLHPQPSYASAVQLLSRAGLLLRQARDELFSADVSLKEEIIPLSRDDLADLERQVQELDMAAKRGLFGVSVEKPLFFDTAFNYVDLPMDDLMMLAGRKASSPASGVERMTEAIGNVADKLTEVRKVVSEKGQDVMGSQSEESKSKSWLGGWFNRG
ncbi:hypothetical protein M231_06076 [Tremella mesenterica]|uniref:Signal recognition particle subunit SRP68 n=1 Tax=Tremella mesenterica TaxID=5217 RepID=A0A4Q1BGJ2_TREME|nr:uncharacterized protein TREMEDRAFT_37192 [Tremella mesenterica DSM 1558]EIW73163.1 hypothetical protein TREMEDRAFT_37192 [Tremella mesenterica DSM 1558]RXK36689.1 hypothetical protein M231_06076 [Tremella mesenterica]